MSQLHDGWRSLSPSSGGFSGATCILASLEEDFSTPSCLPIRHSLPFYTSSSSSSGPANIYLDIVPNPTPKSIPVHSILASSSSPSSAPPVPTQHTTKTYITSTSPPPSSPPPASDMLYFTSDPYLGGLVFSVSPHGDRFFGEPLSVWSVGGGMSLSTTDMLHYAHSTVLQLSHIARNHAWLLSQVRTGGAVLLAGAGSLLCYKLWCRWSRPLAIGAGQEGDQPSPGQGRSLKRFLQPARAFISSLVEDELLHTDNDEDVDPSMIQMYDWLLLNYSHKMGRYFGPEDGACYRLSAFSTARWQRRQLLGSSASSSASASANCTPPARIRRIVYSSSSSSSDKDCSSESEAVPVVEVRRTEERRRVKRRSRSEMEKRLSTGTVKSEATSHASERTPSRRVPHYANAGTDDEQSPEEKSVDSCEGLLSSASYWDLMEKMRSRQIRRSISREASSSLSGVLSPCGSSQRMMLRRESSVCSNLSDFAMSECSEFSIDADVKEDANQTCLRMEELFENLEEVKTSIHEIDESFHVYNSQPNPYMLRMTYASDPSLSLSPDHMPDLSSASSHQHSPAHQREAFSPVPAGTLMPPPFAKPYFSLGHGEASPSASSPMPSDTEAESSLEWDLPQQERVTQTSQHAAASPLPNTAGSNSVLARAAPSLPMMKGFDVYKESCCRRQLLPNHSVMELDFEAELVCSDSSEAQMNGSNSALGAEALRLALTSNVVIDTLSQAGGSFSTIMNSSLDSQNSILDAFEEEPVELNKYSNAFSSMEFNPDSNESEDVNKLIVCSEDMVGFAPLKEPTSTVGMTESTDSAINVSSMNVSADFTGSFNGNSGEMWSDLEQTANGHAWSALNIGEQQEKGLLGMTISTDSAVYSEPASRSATSSPVENKEYLPSTPMRRSPGLGKTRKTCADSKENAEECKIAVESESLKTSPPGIDGDSESNGAFVQSRKAKPRSELNNIVNDNFSKCIQQINTRNASRGTNNKNSQNLQGLVEDSEDDLNGNSENSDNSFQYANERYLNSQVNSTEGQERNHNNRTDNVPVLPTKTHGLVTDGRCQYAGQLDCDANGNSCVVAPSSGDDPDRASALAPVGERRSVAEYGQSEWQGSTQRATIMRQGYAATPQAVGQARLRVVRGDNYCAVRAAIFQALRVGRIPPSGASALATIRKAAGGANSWLNKWTFAGRLHFDDTFTGMETCLTTLETLSASLATAPDAEEHIIHYLNTAPRIDLQVCEAVKLHMLAAAIDLYQRHTAGADIPLFAVIMFARESSQTLTDFVTNHLNTVGDSGGLEQVDMFLLGHALRIILRVVRPSCWGAEDFVCRYPDAPWPEEGAGWPELTLMAEDDRHYNVLV